MPDTTIGLDLLGKRRTLRFPDYYLASNFLNTLRQPFLTPTDQPVRIVDVGACVGGWTVAQSASVPQAVFDCFEPWPPAWGYFRVNTEWNKRITLHRQAASDAPGIRNMVGDDSNFGKTSFYGSDTGPFRAVDAVRLDDVLAGEVNLLKIDAEGHELRVLAGAERILRQYQPYVVVEVLGEQMRRGGWTEYDLRGFMTRHGYGEPEKVTINDWLFKKGTA